MLATSETGATAEDNKLYVLPVMSCWGVSGLASVSVLKLYWENQTVIWLQNTHFFHLINKQLKLSKTFISFDLFFSVLRVKNS